LEQAALDPANFVPGIGPSPDRMLQACLFASATRSATGSASTTPGCR
jgi:catalase